jgi:hypothetical protein
MRFPIGTTRRVLQPLARGTGRPIIARNHHPDPFNPKITKGWKAALKVRSAHAFFGHL